MRWIIFRFRRLITKSDPQFLSYIPLRGCEIYRLGNHAYVIYREQVIDPQVLHLNTPRPSETDEVRPLKQALGDIFFYYVHQRRRGSRVAKVLFNYLVSRIKHVIEWGCEVAVTNQNSILALLRTGFRRQATRNAYYNSNIPAILLKLCPGGSVKQVQKLN